MQQYIRRSAECAINISSSTRNQCIEIFNQLEDEQTNNMSDKIRNDITGADSEVQNVAGGTDITFAHKKHAHMEMCQSDKELCTQYVLLLDHALDEIVGL